AQMQRLLIHYLLIGVCIFLATAVIGLQAISSVSRHLQTLTQSIQDLVKCEFAPKPEAQNDLQQISESYRDEVGYLARAFLSMQRALQSYLQNLARTTAQKEKIQSELRIAHNIQMSMVPHRFPRPEETGGIMLHAVLEPAREVGGDFYDFFPLTSSGDRSAAFDHASSLPVPDRLAFAIGDVSGKGMPAALFMAMVKTLFRATAAACSDPARILSKLNDEMSRDNATSMFTTMQVGIIDLRTRMVTLASGGHNYPLLISAEGKVREMKLQNALPIGVYESVSYTNQEFTLQEGDTLVLFTDGITEAMNEKLEEFSDERFQAILEGKQNTGLEQLSTNVYQEVRRYAGTQDPSDDATLLLIRVFKPQQKIATGGPTLSETAAFGLAPTLPQPAAPSNSSHRQTVEIRDSADLKQIQDWLDREAPAWGLSQPDTHDLHLILDELIENVLRHGYANTEPAQIRLEVTVAPESIALCLRDTGRAFNPLLQQSPDTTSAVATRAVGGWGIHLVKQYSDTLSYERQNDQNVVRLSIRRRALKPQEGVTTDA
ncbi:MAG TPA: SpoIIE family protein phosphatase, partial [Candidatus Ozemobacteraceae bacterium]|nr:SpoIIE family protein phosphatase [Candidatus Ozemobacteraceae bacterium]